MNSAEIRSNNFELLNAFLYETNVRLDRDYFKAVLHYLNERSVNNKNYMEALGAACEKHGTPVSVTAQYIEEYEKHQSKKERVDWKKSAKLERKKQKAERERLLAFTPGWNVDLRNLPSSEREIMRLFTFEVGLKTLGLISNYKDGKFNRGRTKEQTKMWCFEELLTEVAKVQEMRLDKSRVDKD